ncbi:MAG TPA: hypothetical protein VH479_01565, partial [Acidimicrobiales bacterium]
MSTTDDARLDALDERGRAAALTLLDDLAARASAAPEVPGPGSSVIHLGPPEQRRRPPGRLWLAAAVVTLLAAVAGAVILVTGDDGRSDVSSEGPLDHLLPSWLPAGMEPLRVSGIPDAGDQGFTADIAVYGDPDAADPWASPLAVVHLAA